MSDENFSSNHETELAEYIELIHKLGYAPSDEDE